MELTFSLQATRAAGRFLKHVSAGLAIIAALSGLFLAGCSDTVTSHYATLAEAKAGKAFERGWLPPVMPTTARDIVEKNDLDVNIGTGSFEYDFRDRDAYIAQLKEAGAVLVPGKTSDILTLTGDKSRWEIELPRNEGVAKYGVRSR